MPSETRLNELVDQFLSRVTGLGDLERRIFTLQSLRQQKNWDPWGSLCGVYYFMRTAPTEREVVNVGVAAPGTLADRVSQGVRTGANPPWDTFAESPDASVGIIGFGREDWYWPLALEAFLIQDLEPVFNPRRYRPKGHQA